MEVNIYKPYYIISKQEKEVWNNYIHNSISYDFYHTWYYHSLERSGDPFLFVFEKNETFIALPLIKREIENTPYYDCTSVYGYAGPVSNVRFEDLGEEMVQLFKESFISFLKSENIISVFSRLHPIINQHLLLDRLGGIFKNGRTVAIDLSQSVEDIRSKYRRAIRQKVNQLRRKGFVVKEAATRDEISAFAKIYNENMKKVGAQAYYFFDEKYFVDLLSANDFESKLLLGYYEDQITSGGVVTFSNNIMQFHLAATGNEYLSEAPMKLLFDEASILGKKLGMTNLHLGGGVGGKEDSLFTFKSGFSDMFYNFYTWRFISNQKVYDSLVEERIKAGEVSNTFPLYRS